MPASFCPPATMPNSAACLIALWCRRRHWQGPMIFAFELCACSRNEEKSALLSGADPAEPLPPLAVTTAAVSRSSAWPKA